VDGGDRGAGAMARWCKELGWGVGGGMAVHVPC